MALLPFAGAPGGASVSQATFTASGKVKQREYNIRDYGAVGNGTTDDLTAIQNAINAAQSASGGIVFFPEGTYIVSGTPQITGSNIVMQGSGDGSEILLASSSLNSSGTTIGIWINGGTNVIVRDLQINGNFSNIAKSGTYQTSSTLWTPTITKYGSTSVKVYIYGGSGVDQTTYLQYRMPIRVTNGTNVLIEDCFLTNSISAGIICDGAAVSGTSDVLVRNNRISLTWDNAIYFNQGCTRVSAIGNHTSDTQYAGVAALYCTDVLIADNIIQYAGPSASDSCGIEVCGSTGFTVTDNFIDSCLFEGIELKTTNQTNITNGDAGLYDRNKNGKVSGNTISNCQAPNYPSNISVGIDFFGCDNVDVSDNKIEKCDYGISVGSVNSMSQVRNNTIRSSTSWGIQIGNSDDNSKTTVIGNIIQDNGSNGVTSYAPVIFKENFVQNNGGEGIDLVAPPTGLPYKTDYIENNVFCDNLFNGVHAEAGAGNLAVIRNNEFYNSDSLTFTDGVSAVSTTFTSATAGFIASDKGAIIVIMGVGNSSGSTTLTTTIASVSNSTTVILAAAASVARSAQVFTLYRAKNVYFDGSMSSTSLTSATANFTSADVGLTVLLYSSDGPGPSLLGSYTVASVSSSTIAVLSAAPTSNSNILFVIKRNLGKQGRAVYVSNSSDIHYINNRSWEMSTENYPNGAISNNSYIGGNYDFGSNTSNQNPILNPITPIANSQTFTAFPGQKDSVFQMNAASGALNVFLPDTGTVTKGTIYTVKKIDTSANTVTVNGTSSQTLDGASTYVLTSPKQVATFISDGSNWQSTSGQLGATVPILNGGTGQTTANTAFNALAPSQTSNSGKFLTTNGTNTSWASVSGAVSSVSNSDGTLTISPTTGSVVASIATSAALPGSPTTTTQSAGDNSTKIATDAFVTTAVNNAIAGVNPAVAVQAATTLASNTSSLTYNNGVSGVGATFTGSNNTAIVVDGYTFTAIGQRLLVKNDTQSPSGAFNGIYYVTQIQTSLLPPILTRALDYDQPSDMNNTGAIPVQNGTVNISTSWLLTSQVVTVGTTPLTYVQFSINPTTVMTTTTYDAANIAQQVVGTTATQTLTNKRVTKRVSALSANSATPAINTDTTDVVNITAQTTAITSFTTNLTGTPVDGDTLRISITGTAAVALTWGTSFEASTVALPTTTVTTARLDVGFFWNTATSKWRCEASA